MAEFQTVMREYDRMCAKNIRCDNCPLSSINNGNNGVSCQMSVCKSPKIAECIIMQWAAEHPLITNRRKFEEVFGFTPATMFEVNQGNADWLDAEYKEKQNG